jgi:hypothetical protein
MAAKPLVDIQIGGKRIVVDFSREVHGHITLRYDIEVNGRKVKTNLFAEEVFRWMAKEMTS